MSTILNTKKIFHRPQVELSNPIPAVNAAGSFVKGIKVPALNLNHHFFCVNTTSSVYAWDPATDTEMLLPASGIAGTFGAGSCGKVHPMGPSGTASAGGTNTLTTTLTIPNDLRGYRIRITGGPGIGDERIIASNTMGANAVITVSAAFSATITSSSTYVLLTPRFWVFNPAATPGLGYWDVALSAWTAGKTVTGVTFTGTDGLLIGTPGIGSNQIDAADIGVWPNGASGPIGTATAVFGSCVSTLVTLTSGRNWTVGQWNGAVVSILAGTGSGQTRTISSNTALSFTTNTAFSPALDATSVWQITKAPVSSAGLSTFSSTTSTILTVTGSAWTSSQFVNMQIRVIAGTGAGQIRTITANTGTTITTAAWTTNLDATSIWVIEGCDDNLYLLGNAAVAMFKYTISGNTWSTATATAARAGAPGAGLSAAWINGVNDSSWSGENALKNARYIYSFRGGATNTLDYYDLALTTWTSNLIYGNQAETFTTGVCYDYDGINNIYIMQAATGRCFYYDVLRNTLLQACEHNIPQGAAIVGDKLYGVPYVDGSTRIYFLYHWLNTSQILVRIMMWQLY
jgi:hypothetical protein